LRRYRTGHDINKLCIVVSVGGAAGAVSRITGALGKGIATLTMDDEYQKKRQEALNRRPTGIGEGFARGGKGLVMVNDYTYFISCLFMPNMCYPWLHKLRSA